MLEGMTQYVFKSLKPTCCMLPHDEDCELGSTWAVLEGHKDPPSGRILLLKLMSWLL